MFLVSTDTDKLGYNKLCYLFFFLFRLLAPLDVHEVTGQQMDILLCVNSQSLCCFKIIISSVKENLAGIRVKSLCDLVQFTKLQSDMSVIRYVVVKYFETLNSPTAIKKKSFTHTEDSIQLHQRPLILLQRSQEFVQLGLNQKSLSSKQNINIRRMSLKEA